MSVEVTAGGPTLLDQMIDAIHASLMRREALSLFLLLALPGVLFAQRELPSSDLGSRLTKQQTEKTAPSFGLPAVEDDTEDDFDDVLPHQFAFDSTRLGHPRPETAGHQAWSRSTERPHRPPIG